MLRPVQYETSGAVIDCEALYCSVASSVIRGIPRPPFLTGSARSCLSVSLMLLRPVMAGRSLCLIASSIGCSFRCMLGMTGNVSNG